MESHAGVLDHVQKLWGMEEIKTFADKF